MGTKRAAPTPIEVREVFDKFDLMQGKMMPFKDAALHLMRQRKTNSFLRAVGWLDAAVADPDSGLTKVQLDYGSISTIARRVPGTDDLTDEPASRRYRDIRVDINGNRPEGKDRWDSRIGFKNGYVYPMLVFTHVLEEWADAEQMIREEEEDKRQEKKRKTIETWQEIHGDAMNYFTGLVAIAGVGGHPLGLSGSAEEDSTVLTLQLWEDDISRVAAALKAAGIEPQATYETGSHRFPRWS